MRGQLLLCWVVAIWFSSIVPTNSNRVNATEIDFDTEIVPLLSKAGCNAASCHGSAAGQAGFRLSLFGGDPAFDYRTIARELSGRRINLARPSDSMIILKSTAQIDHGGGDILKPDGESAKTIQQWIAEGAHRLRLRKLNRLIVEPREYFTDSIPASVQLTVTAVFDDGDRQDVTRQTVYVSQNESALTVDEFGLAKITSQGQHSAILRFAGKVAVVSIITPIGSTPVTHSEITSRNWIDEEINEKLHQLRIAPTSSTTDPSFLRRVSLDLTGQLPSKSQYEEFITDTNPDKRAAKIDELLGSRQFIDYWTHRIALHMRIRKPGNDSVAINALYAWIRDSVADDTGWDKIARTVLLSEGDSHLNGAATVHRFFSTSREQAEYISEVLMGIRLRCANCHNHPLDDWTQDDYHGLAAIFAGVERNREVRFVPSRNIIHPRTGEHAIPRIPGDRFLSSTQDGRPEFASWLTQHDNPFFAKAIAGRVWQALMGNGLVSPVDDLRTTNPASHSRLFSRLASFFAKNNFQLRPLIRLICNSAAYQRSSFTPEDSTNNSAQRFYACAIQKPLSAEVLADAISDVTGVADDFNGVGRAINVVDRATSSNRLQFLGQCLPGESCTTPNGSNRGIASKLHLMNGELLNAKIINESGRLQQLLRNDVPISDLVSDFYVQALCRLPTDRELTDWVKRLSATGKVQKREQCEDFLWALLNCHEFTNNQ